MEQLCIDKISGSLRFKSRVRRLHLDSPNEWYVKMLYRLLMCGLNKVSTILYRNPMIPPPQPYFIPVHGIETDRFRGEGYIDNYLEYYALSNEHKSGYKITRYDLKRRYYPIYPEWMN